MKFLPPNGSLSAQQSLMVNRSQHRPVDEQHCESDSETGYRETSIGPLSPLC